MCVQYSNKEKSTARMLNVASIASFLRWPIIASTNYSRTFSLRAVITSGLLVGRRFLQARHNVHTYCDHPWQAFRQPPPSRRTFFRVRSLFQTRGWPYGNMPGLCAPHTTRPHFPHRHALTNADTGLGGPSSPCITPGCSIGQHLPTYYIFFI